MLDKFVPFLFLCGVQQLAVKGHVGLSNSLSKDMWGSATFCQRTCDFQQLPGKGHVGFTKSLSKDL